MTPDEALVTLGEAAADAVAGVLRTFVNDGLDQGAVTVVAKDVSPFAELPLPAIAASVSYVDDVTGGTVLVFGNAAAKQLAAAMTSQESNAEEELSEIELSAIAEAMNQMMAAAAAATSATLGQEINISAPETTFLTTAEDAVYPESPYATTVSFSLLGQPCSLIQLVPNAFVARLTHALELAAEASQQTASGATVTGDNLRSVPLRVWAELGRTRLPLSRAVSLPPGSVVELDARAEDPVDVFVSGRRFAQGVLVLAEDGEWAVRVEQLLLAPQVITAEGNTE
jgi:flagellar motor switch protein FliN/FliY